MEGRRGGGRCRCMGLRQRYHVWPRYAKGDVCSSFRGPYRHYGPSACLGVPGLLGRRTQNPASCSPLTAPPAASTSTPGLLYSAKSHPHLPQISPGFFLRLCPAYVILPCLDRLCTRLFIWQPKLLMQMVIGFVIYKCTTYHLSCFVRAGEAGSAFHASARPAPRLMPNDKS
jgi:hypothetical protein